MKKLSATAVSSSEVDHALGVLPAPVRDFLHARDDELQRFRAGPARARQARSENIEEALRECYDDHRLKIEYYPLRSRTGVLEGLLKTKTQFERYGLTRKPDIEKCRDAVYEKAGVKRKPRSARTGF